MIRIPFLIIVFCMSCLPVAGQAADLCAGKLSSAEKMICSNNELGHLDAILNNAYQSTFQITKNKSALKTQQHKWLVAVRGRCESDECLERVYIDRINELIYSQIQSLNIIEKPLSQKEAKDVCLSLAKLADNKRLSLLSVPGKPYSMLNDNDVKAGWGLGDKENAMLESRGCRPEIVYKLKLKAQKEPVRFGKISIGGTCPSDTVLNLDNVLNDKQEEQLEEIEIQDARYRLREEVMGLGDYPIIYRGRYFIAMSSAYKLNGLDMVSWINPDGEIEPLCSMEVQSVKKVVISAKNKTLCYGIANGTIRPMKGKPITEKIPFNHNSAGYRDEFEKRFGKYAGSVDLLHIDINGDGVSENVGQFTYESGAGCGSTNIWLGVLTEDYGNIVKNSLNKQLDKLGGHSLNIYKFQDKYYIETSIENSANNGVVQIKGEQIEQVCEFEEKTRTDVKEYIDIA